MKNVTSNRVNMINATITFCDGNTSATSGIIQFANVLGDVKSKMILINSLNQIAGGTTTGVTLDTNALRRAMTALALKCANGTLAYANATNNNTLAALVNFNESKFIRAKKEEVDDMCEGIRAATDANIAAVVDYGVAATDVTDLQSAIDLYRTASQNPRFAVITKSQANKQMEVMVKEVIDNLLVKQLDKMVNTLKTVNFVFWDGYRQARDIIDLCSTTAKLSGTVLNENDVPLINVDFTVYAAGTTEVLKSAKTDVKGKYNVSKLAAGMVDFKWALTGYSTVVETDVKIVAGKELRRNVTMLVEEVRQGNLSPENVDTVFINNIGWAINTVQLSAGLSTMRFYTGLDATSNYIDVLAGQVLNMPFVEFAAAIGLNAGDGVFLVKNVGSVNGSWKVVFG
jgi:hypothetical protein